MLAEDSERRERGTSWTRESTEFRKRGIQICLRQIEREKKEKKEKKERET